MSNTEVLIALLIVVGIPCLTIIGVAWLFVKGMKKDLK
jgi:uncharacterized protein YneF (UPF0154 family)